MRISIQSIRTVLYGHFYSICYFRLQQDLKNTIISQNQGNNTNADVLQHSSDIRNQPGGSTQDTFNREILF